MTSTTGASYQVEQPWPPASEGITDWGEDFHALLLGDRLRMAAFRAAIREVVTPGAVVVDLGTGTGILAQWALEAGAARVYGIDFNQSILDTAVEQVTAAGHGTRFHPVHGMSFDIELPERADVIVSETLGNLADNEGCVRILTDARSRFLADGGTLVPRRVETYLVPVAATRAHEAVRRGGGPLGNTDQPPLPGTAGPFDTYYDTVVPWSAHLATPRLARAYEFTVDESDEYQVTLSFLIRHEGAFTGFRGYFIADLSDTVTMDISGDEIAYGMTSDSWKHCYLPVEHPIPVRRGDRLTLSFSRRSSTKSFGQRYRWAGAVLRDTDVVGSFDQCSGVTPARQG